MAHSFYGFILLQSGKTTQALEQCQIAKSLDRASPLFHHHLGHPYFVWRRFDEALKYYQESLELESQHYLGHYFKGRVYEEQGDFRTALQEFERFEEGAETLNAKRKTYYAELREAARLRGATGYWEKRLEYALKESPQDFYKIASLYARLGEKEKVNAYVWLRKACDRKAFSQGLLFDLCWDQNDPQFQAIARGIGLLR